MGDHISVGEWFFYYHGGHADERTREELESHLKECDFCSKLREDGFVGTDTDE
jgi:hypothetical protein